MNEGLKADEKKDCRNSQNGIGTRLGMEVYQSEPTAAVGVIRSHWSSPQIAQIKGSNHQGDTRRHEQLKVIAKLS
jgi:hypothetical protein